MPYHHVEALDEERANHFIQDGEQNMPHQCKAKNNEKNIYNELNGNNTTKPFDFTLRTALASDMPSPCSSFSGHWQCLTLLLWMYWAWSCKRHNQK
jgi:hypothetical protein